jgi:hypothetical protein
MNSSLQKIHGNKKITTEIFIKKAQQVHGDKYSYAKSSYSQYHKKLIIICFKHGDFSQSPYLHLRGSGCPACYGNERLTTKKFIHKAQEIHGNKYDYKLTLYKNNKTKVNISCPIHGEFHQRPHRHLRGDGCPKCGIITASNKNTKTTLQFIQKAQKTHNNKYDYTLSEYVHCEEKIKIICPIHGTFSQAPSQHLSGQGCPKCSIASPKYSQSTIIEKFLNVHGNIYNYSLVNYENYNTPVKIICSKHGIFNQTPKTHIDRKSGCPKCANDNRKNKLTLPQSEFITISNKTHNSKYDYSLVEYKNNRIKVKIICPIHGIFEQNPFHHMNGVGCPHCNDSKGELKVKEFLENNNILYTRNKTFDDCFDIHRLRFDFYLPYLNTIIEFDGIQHYRPIEAWGGNDTFIKLQRRDKIKNEYCNNNLIPLIRIRYNDNVENKLNILL